MKKTPLPLSSFSDEKLARIKAVFFDIDDTFSGAETNSGSDHRISDEAYQALWRLHRAGIKTIPVTGRPAGWCDMIVRMWPVNAVVGENGAFYSYLSKKSGHTVLTKKYLESEKTRKANALKLSKLRKNIEKKFPGSRVPSDQGYREFDLAVDYCEDVPRWKDSKVQKLLEFCHESGAQAKLSSIHVNTWFGKYDKWTCVQRVLKDLFKISSLTEIVYLGDSPNDEPFFQALPLTVGVANLVQFLDRVEFAPTYITKQKSGLGFAEFAEKLLTAPLSAMERLNDERDSRT